MSSTENDTIPVGLFINWVPNGAMAGNSFAFNGDLKVEFMTSKGQWKTSDGRGLYAISETKMGSIMEYLCIKTGYKEFKPND